MEFSAGSSNGNGPATSSSFFEELSSSQQSSNNSMLMLGDQNGTGSPGTSNNLAAAAAAAAFLHHAVSANNGGGMESGVGGGGGSGMLNGRSNSISIVIGDNGGGGGGSAASSGGCMPGTSGMGRSVGGGGSNSASRNASVADGMQPRQRRKVPEGELCAVCSDRATGYHYGVASCNGCKTFFRRTIVSEHTFVCQYQGNCDVNKNVRCACRHCRFNKCVSVGMDARAIQNDRDRIGPTKKFRMAMASGGEDGSTMMSGVGMGAGGGGSNKRYSSADDDQMSMTSLSPPQRDDKLFEQLIATENLTNQLRNCRLEECKSVRETLLQPSLLYQLSTMEIDEATQYKELYPASMNDIQMWNIRELRLCLEWVKTFDEFTKLSEMDQYYLVRNFAFTFNILNRVFYSLNHGPDRIVYPNGAFILRQAQEQVRIPGCRSIYHRQMDEIMLPFRELNVTIAEFALFKAILLFNPDVCDLSPEVRKEIKNERTRYSNALLHLMVSQNGFNIGGQKFGALLMMAPSIQNIIDQNDENMQVMEVFGNFWRINGFVKELCMK